MQISDVAVQYGDQNNKTRWGYVTTKDFRTINDYHNKVRQFKENQDNELLKAEIQQMSGFIIKVYLADGTTGDAEIKSLFMVEPFAKYTLEDVK